MNNPTADESRIQYQDFDEQSELVTENARIAELKTRRDYWLSKAHGCRESIMIERSLWYADRVEDLEQIPFVNVWLPKQAVIAEQAIESFAQAA